MEREKPFLYLLFTIYYSLLLQWLSSGESCVNIVPPFDLIALAEVPAEQDHAPVAQGRKIYQAALVIFELDAEGFKLAGARGEFGEDAYIFCAAGHAAAAVLSAFGCILCSLAVFKQTTVSALNGLNNAPHGRKQCVRFFNTEDFHKNGSQ